jgi:hypothetical protein
MSGSSTSSPPHATDVKLLQRPEIAACKKNAGSSSRSVAHPAREDQHATRPRMAPSGPSTSEARRDPPHQADLPKRSEEQVTPCRHIFNGSNRPDSDSLQRRPSWVKSTGSASTPSAPQEVDSGVAPRRLQSLIIWEPWTYKFPRRRRGPRTKPAHGEGRKVSPRAAGGA